MKKVKKIKAKIIELASSLRRLGGGVTKQNMWKNFSKIRVRREGKRAKMKFRTLFGLILLVVLLVLVGIKLWAGRSTEAAWFDVGYGFRQKIPISNSSGSTQTDFQVQLTGSNAIDTASLIADGKMQSDCDDMRFTSISGQTLPFWVEPTTCNTASTIVWVKVPSISSQTSGVTTDIYFYYGNPSANAAGYTTSQVFIQDIAQAAASWPLDDTTTTQSYSRVTNPAVATGRDMVINGGFDSDDGTWTKGTGWTIASGVATSDGTGNAANLFEAIPLIAGKAYTVTFTVTSYTSGGVRPVMCGNTGGTYRSALGTYTETLICVGNLNIYMQTQSTGTGSFVGSIDDVIVTQLNIPASTATPTQLIHDGDMELNSTVYWGAGNTASVTKNTASPHSGVRNLRVTGAADDYAYNNEAFAAIGTAYRVYGYFRGDGASGVPRIRQFGSAAILATGTTSNTWQPFDFVVVADHVDLIQLALVGGAGYAEFDDVTVSLDTGIRQGEIAQDGGTETWASATDLTNWTETLAGTSTVNQEASVIHGGTYAARLDVDASNSLAQIRQFVLAVGKTYRVTFWARASTTGKSLASDSGIFSTTGNLTTSYAYYEFTGVATTTVFDIKRNSGASASFYIDDVTVTEVAPLVGKPLLGVTLGSSSGAGGHLTNAYTFDGTNDNVNIYSSDLNSVFNPDEGTVVAWVKVSGSGVWTDGSIHRIGYISVDANNRIVIQKTATNNQLAVSYVAGGTIDTVVATSSSTDWINIVITWSKSQDKVEGYFNGVAGTTSTVLGTWSGNLVSTGTVIGAEDTSGNNRWSGMINDVRVYNRALSAGEIANQYSASSDIQAYTTGNYQGSELLRKYNTSVTVGTAATEEVGAGPVGYWKMDEGTGQTINDGTSNSNEGTLGANSSVASDDPTWQTEDQCVNGKCLSFDGTADYSKVTNSASLALSANQAFTINYWVKLNSLPSGTIYATVSKGSFTTSYSHLITSTSNLNIYTSGDANTDYTATNYFLNETNKWVFVSQTYDGDKITVYKNGAFFGQSSTGKTLATSALALYLGSNNSSQYYLNGYLDEVKIYPYARSAAQVKVDFNQGAEQLGKKNQQSFLSNGLVGYWKMNESSGTLADSSGNGNTGTWAGTGLSHYTLGKFGNGGGFGTDDYVAATGLTTVGTSGGTFSTWVKTSTDFSDTGMLVYGANNGGDGFGANSEIHTYFSNTETIGFFIEGGSGTDVNITSTTTYADGNWHHVVGTWDTSSAALYIDGIIVNSASTTGITSFTFADGIKIGRPASATRYFTGNIDDARVYNRALSGMEVADLYNWAPGPVGYWKMDESTWTNDCSTDTVFDSSGSGLNGDACANGTGPTRPGTGKFGNAAELDGVNDYLSLPDSDLIDFAYNQDFTVSAWIKVPSTQSNTDATANSIVEKWSGGAGGYPFVIRVANQDHATFPNKITTSRYDGTNNPASVSTTSVNDNAWHYVTYTKSGSTLSLYIDGKREDTDTDTTTGTTTNASPLFIASRNGSYPFQGSVDDVKIYNYARTSSQINEDMNAGHPVGGSPISSILAHYKFDEQQGQVINNSGNGGSGLNGTRGADATATVDDPTWKTKTDCKTNGCLSFDGSDDYVNLGSPTSLQLTQYVTISAWIKPNSITNANAGGIVVNNSRQGFWQLDNSDDLRGWIRKSDDSGYVLVNAPNVLTAGTWIHVAQTFDGNQLRLWVNGKLVDSTAYTGTMLTSGAVPWIIGNFYTGGDVRDFNGLIDEVKIYNVALTGEQIKIDMNAGASLNFGVTAAAESTQLTDGAGNPPIMQWNLDENTGTNAADTSGNGNDGTLTNTPTWATGKYGHAVNFAGSDQHIIRADDADLDFAAGASFTLETWFRHTTASAQQVILSKFNEAGYKLLMESDGDITCGIDYDSTWTPTDSVTSTAATYDDNNWHHIACVKNANTSLTLYIDGISVGTVDASLTNSTLENSDPIYYGIDSDGTSNDYVGQLDNLVVYTYARTQAQVAYDYNRGGPVVYWKLDECQGTVANDSSGNGKSGTITIGASGEDTAGTCNTSSTAWGSGATGKFNSSLSFDGVDDYISFTSSGIINVSQGSVSLWFKQPSAQDSNGAAHYLFSHPQGGVANSRIYINTDSTGSTIAGRLGDATTIGSASITTGVWYHIVLTWNGTAATFYVNGNNRTTTGTFNGLTSLFATSYLACNSGDCASSQGFAGQIDDTGVYNYALSATQIKKLYNQGAGVRFGPVTGSP